MNKHEVRRCQGERGASLILAIVFMLFVGTVTAAVLASTNAGINDRSVLDQARNRQYAADGAIERSITRVRGLTNPGANPAECTSPDTYPQLNGFAIRVDCVNAPTVAGAASGSLDLQNNVIFTACVNTGIACSNTTDVVRAQVNFQVTVSPPHVTTTVQSWSVNG